MAALWRTYNLLIWITRCVMQIIPGTLVHNGISGGTLAKARRRDDYGD